MLVSKVTSHNTDSQHFLPAAQNVGSIYLYEILIKYFVLAGDIHGYICLCEADFKFDSSLFSLKLRNFMSKRQH